MSCVRRAKKSTIENIRVVDRSLSDSWTNSKLRTIDEVICKESMNFTRHTSSGNQKMALKRKFTKAIAMEKLKGMASI